jgi:predicted RNase H-like nuclease (RuvC/YqgF family)
MLYNFFIDRVAKAEESLQDDGEVSRLEEECNWFRNETIRLQSHSQSMQNDIYQMQSRLTALWDQCNYLSDQLKTVMKKSRVVEVRRNN